VLCPSRVDRESRTLRTISLTLTMLLSLVNGWSAIWLGLIHEAGMKPHAGSLLGTGAAIWLTNIIAFALWYWQFDRGGPAARAHARKAVPDFQFVQMQNPKSAGRNWKPEFIDYLYLSFTNATAFSPTNVMPLSRWAKLTMLAQSLISLITMALVIARAVNIPNQQPPHGSLDASTTLVQAASTGVRSPELMVRMVFTHERRQ
jgi:hypothetical protein